MSRRLTICLLGALALTPAGSALATTVTQPSLSSEGGNPISRPGQQLSLPLIHNLGDAGRPRLEPRSARVRRPDRAAQSHRQDGHRLWLLGRAIRAPAAQRLGRTERSLTGRLPEHQLLRERHRSAICQRERSAQVGSDRSRRAVRMARPPHPLDEPGHAAAGQGHKQAHQDLRLECPDQGRNPERSDRRTSSSGCPRARRRPPGRSPRSSQSSSSPPPSWSSCAGAAAHLAREPRQREAW